MGLGGFVALNDFLVERVSIVLALEKAAPKVGVVQIQTRNCLEMHI